MINSFYPQILCERCATLLEEKKEGRSQGMICPVCGWSVMTTVIPEIERDTKLYDIYISKNDYRDKLKIKALSEISGLNFLRSREIMINGGKIISQEKATNIVCIKNKLMSVNIKFSIFPEFNW